MPSAKSKKRSPEGTNSHGGPSTVSRHSAAGQSLKEARKAARKQRAKATRLKRKTKSKEAMNLPTRLARLLRFKQRNALASSGEGASGGASPQVSGVGSPAATSQSGRKNALKGEQGAAWIGSFCKSYSHSGLLTTDVIGACALSTSATNTCSTSGGKDSCGEDSNSKFGSCRQFRLIPKERIIALDCEMVGVGPEGRQSALGRCSIVDYDGGVVYDAYVRPELEIQHYRTPWSGIRAHHMRDAVPFRQAQQQIADILRGKVLVGHSLHFDIQVLRIRHPVADVRDTSTYRGLRELAGLTLPAGQHPGLKKLTRLLFGHSIQAGEHCSVEDARATMNLYKLVERRWEEERVSAFPDGDFRASFMDDHFWPDDLDQ